jgi:hypothetical protein
MVTFGMKLSLLYLLDILIVKKMIESKEAIKKCEKSSRLTIILERMMERNLFLSLDCDGYLNPRFSQFIDVVKRKPQI